MSAPAPVRLASVKFTAVGRAQSFLVDRLPDETALRPGDQVVVQTVVLYITQLDCRGRV